MGRIGEGYGSEFHLRGHLAAPARLNATLGAETGLLTETITWLPFPKTIKGEREYRGLEFLKGTQEARVLPEWRKFWPTTGRAQTWDAVGLAGSEWLLVEAKANWPEFCSGGTKASGDGLRTIEKTLNRVKRDLGVHRYFTWTASYYQYTNRLAALWFLRKHGVQARLVFVHFVGDAFPDGTSCPGTAAEWDALVEARRLTLGLPERHALADAEHHVVLKALEARSAKRDT